MTSITIISIILTKVEIYYTNGKTITQCIRRLKNKFSRTELISKSFFVVVCLFNSMVFQPEVTFAP